MKTVTSKSTDFFKGFGKSLLGSTILSEVQRLCAQLHQDERAAGKLKQLRIPPELTEENMPESWWWLDSAGKAAMGEQLKGWKVFNDSLQKAMDGASEDFKTRNQEKLADIAAAKKLAQPHGDDGDGSRGGESP